MRKDDILYGIMDHEKIGADHLKSLNFHDLVVDIVRNHVNAKRYLITKNKNYAISKAS